MKYRKGTFVKKIAILQSNYIPWKGYFDIINMADEFVLYDEMQFTKRDWRNRNIIKTANGTQWLTIPVITKGKFEQRIMDTEVLSPAWTNEHWRALQCNYAKAEYFDRYAKEVQELYRKCSEEKYLSRINFIFLKGICDVLQIETKFSWSTDYKLGKGKTEKLVNICMQADADEYISGPAASDYIDNKKFESKNIVLTYMDYSGYQEYPQLYGEFEHRVTMLDLLFHTGENAKNI